MQIEHRLRQAVHERAAPGFAFGIQAGGAEPLRYFAGHHRPDGGPAVDARTRFDLASLTKPLTTTLWALRLVDQGRLDLAMPIGALIDVDDEALAATPVWRLLNHTSGLPAHRRYYEGLGPNTLRSGQFGAARGMIRRLVLHAELKRPPGTAEVYSDLGFLLLGWILEALDAPLAEIWPTLPGHGPDALHFRPITDPRAAQDPRYAATEACPWRDRLLQGEVHDDNCWTMGGIGGHAGLFGTLDATLNLAHAWLRALKGDRAALGLETHAAARFISPRWMHSRGTHLLGWDTPTPGRSTSGTRFSRRSVGHLGFTGTSIWIDLEREVAMVLLTNRVSPSRDNLAGIRALRPEIHDLAWGLLP